MQELPVEALFVGNPFIQTPPASAAHTTWTTNIAPCTRKEAMEVPTVPTIAAALTGEGEAVRVHYEFGEDLHKIKWTLMGEIHTRY